MAKTRKAAKKLGQRGKTNTAATDRTRRKTSESLSSRDDLSKGSTLLSSARDKGARTGLSLFNKNMFTDPFFSSWDDLFNIPSFEDITHKARDLAKKAIKGTRNIDTSTPGSHSSRSFYRSYSHEGGKEPQRELISQESRSNVDEKGHVYTERWKTCEKGNTKKTTHTRMIDDKGIKEMRTHNLDTGEEYLHTDYKKLSEKEQNNFLNNFERGITSTTRPALSGGFSRALPSMTDTWGRDFTSPHFGHYHPSYDRFGFPSMSSMLPSTDYDFWNETLPTTPREKGFGTTTAPTRGITSGTASRR